ncbi:hypothetical protein niasHT_014801 [Heterodera trifolii]|uniref:Uncharacterized protein n=1 Tax=Heterodera trifolii TaxID=157864 RepID=A0ABD2KI96_9BILA
MNSFLLSDCESVLQHIATEFGCVTPVPHFVERDVFILESRDQPRKIIVWEEGDMIRTKGIDNGNGPRSTGYVGFFEKKRGAEEFRKFIRKGAMHFFVTFGSTRR